MSLKKSIVIITQTLLSGGAEKQSVYLAKVLSKQYKVSLVVLRGKNIEQKFLIKIENDDINLVRLNGGLIKNCFDMYRIFKKEKFEIIFSYLASGNFINGTIGFLSGVPNRIGGIRNAELSSKKLPFEKFFHNHLLTSTISNSHSAVIALSKLGFKKDKFYVIHNAFDLKQSFLFRKENKEINILSVARFVPQKDYYTALKAISILKKRINESKLNFKYYLIGYGDLEKQIRNWINELNIDDVTKVVIKPDNLFDYFRKADIFLTTSVFEGLSNSVMEAMSFSLPVVVTPAGDMEYLVKDGENGFICEIKNPGQIADRLEKLIYNKEERIKMGINSYHLLSKEFTLERFEEKYLKLIEELEDERKT